MSFPPGVQLRQVTFGVPFALANGDDLIMEVTFTPTRSMVWAATGAPGIARSYKASNNVGLQGSISLPVTDQAGWLDGLGGALSVASGAQTHLYVVDVLYKDATGTVIAKAPTRNLPLPAGDMSPIDLDLLIPVSTTAGVVLSLPDTWSADIAAAQAAAAAAAASAAAAGGLTVTGVKTANYTAGANELILVDATGGALTVTLPAAPADRTRAAIKKIDSSPNVVTVQRGGTSDLFNKAGGPTSVALQLPNQAITLQYAHATGLWLVVDDDLPLSQLDLRFAPLASPAFSGTPTIAGTAIAKTTDISTAISALVGAAPAALDTLKEIDDQLASDEGSAAALSALVAGKAASLTTVGVKTAGYTTSGNEIVPVDATAGSVTVTAPTAPADKTRLVIKKVDASSNVVTIAAAGSDVFNKTGGSTTLALALQNQSTTLQYAASGAIWYIVAGDLPLSQADARYLATTTAKPTVRLGVFPESANPTSEAEYVTASGEPVTVMLVPYNYLMQPNVSALTALNARGVLPQVVWEPNGATEGPSNPSYRLSDILAGTYDAYMTTFLNTIKGLGFPVQLKWAPEMNGNWMAWSEGQNSNTAGQYALAWKHVHDLATTLGVTNISWMWSPTTKYTSSTPLAGLYPGNAYVDIIGVHGYNYGTAGAGGFRSPSTVFDATFDEIATIARGKPLWIAECGTVNTSGEKVQWIADFFAYIVSRGITGFVWYNAIDTSGYNWRVNETTATAAAWTAGVASLRKVAKATGKAVAQADGANDWTGRQNFYGADVVGLPTAALPTPADIGAAPATTVTNFFTANTTLALWNAERRMLFDSPTAVTATIPLNSAVPFPVGTEITFSQNGVGQLTIAAASGVTLHSRGGIFKTAGQFAVAGAIKYDTDVWLVYGDLTA